VGANFTCIASPRDFALVAAACPRKHSESWRQTNLDLQVKILERRCKHVARADS